MGSSKIAVIGGSLTGPATALMLKHAGFDDVTVYESMPPTASPAGGVIGLDHASLDLLDRLGIPQDEFVPFTSERVVAVRVLDRRVAGRVRTIWPGRNTTWNALHDALSSRLDCIEQGKQLTGIRQVGNSCVLTFADGSETEADVVVGADGRRSGVRKIVDTGRKLRYAGYVAHRGTAPLHPMDLADFTRFEPGGTQFNIFPVVRDGEIKTDWTFYLNESADDFKRHYGGSPTVRTFVLPHQIAPDAAERVTAHAGQLLPDREAAMVESTTDRAAASVVDIDAPDRMVWQYGAGRVVLVGDALAPVRPHTASGLNNGLHQAAGLVASLRQHSRWGADLDGALAGWEAMFLPQAVAKVEAGPILGAKLGLG